jgi:hypothetical protein
VVAVEETQDTIYLVLPFRSTEDQDAGELSDRDLEAVAGGGWSTAAGCNTSEAGCQNTDQVNCIGG